MRNIYPLCKTRFWLYFMYQLLTFVFGFGFQIVWHRSSPLIFKILNCEIGTVNFITILVIVELKIILVYVFFHVLVKVFNPKFSRSVFFSTLNVSRTSLKCLISHDPYKKNKDSLKIVRIYSYKNGILKNAVLTLWWNKICIVWFCPENNFI